MISMRKQACSVRVAFLVISIFFVGRILWKQRSIKTQKAQVTEVSVVPLQEKVGTKVEFKTWPVTSGQKLLETLEFFPWTDFKQSINMNNDSDIRNHVNELISILTPFLTEEPKIPVNHSCIVPAPKPREQLHCKTGNLTEPKKIGLLLQLGFDVDVLEIHLNELFDIVDIFFIIEATYSHSRSFLKPLMWERVKYQERFKKFLPKIVHFIVDDVQSINVTLLMNNSSTRMVNFETERLQEQLRWIKFLEWNNATGYFTKTDLLGFGDTDEVASREAVNYLKHCELESDPVDIGIWFPFGSIDQAFLTDFPLYEHPFTLGDPTFWTLEKAMNLSAVLSYHLKYPSRNRGQSKNHVLGGMYMSHYGYLPFLLIKRLTQSEGSLDYIKQVAQFPELCRKMNFVQLQKYYSEEYYKKMKFRIFSLDRVKSIDPEKDEIVVLPWFYNCNRLRYPAWERKPDTRLD